MDKKLSKGIAVVFFTNIISLVFNLLINFLLPKYLNVENYAGIKTFQLYSSYVGLLHLGYVDAVYLRYGGKELTRKISASFSTNLSTMRIFQIVVTAIVLIISIFTRNPLLCLFALSIFPVNMASYYKCLYQATGEFSLYGRIMTISTIMLFLANIVSIFAFRTKNYLYLVFAYVIIYFLVWMVLEKQFYSSYNVERPSQIFSLTELIDCIKKGIFLTVGNLASLFLSSMDRWFVKLLLDVVDFAQYSFAVSVQGFLNIAITPVTTTMYNYFCRERNVEKITYTYEMICVFSTMLASAFFAVKFVLQYYLQNYLGSTEVIALLFGAQIFSVIINSVFVNLYKAEGRQRDYFIKLVAVLILGFLMNVFFYRIFSNKEGFALATLISTIVWFIISILDFRKLKISINSILFVSFQLIVLILVGIKLHAVLGLVVYLVFEVVFGFIFMKKSITEAIKMVHNKYSNR